MTLRRSTVFAFVLLLAGMLCACAGTPRPRDAAATPSQAPRTVAVPDGGGALAAGLQRRLIGHGWQLIGYAPNELRAMRAYRQLAGQARYRLTLTSRRIGDCANGDKSFVYNLAMIENRSGDVAIALTGTQCMQAALADFNASLARKPLVPDGT